jgi:putative DNA primase/helicase
VTAADVAEKLQARRAGDGWIARCPSHDDHSPSLSIREGTGGRLLLKCHAGCSFDEIVSALGLDAREDGRPGLDERHEEARYPYRDEKGKVIVTVIRRRLPSGKKSFTREPTGVTATKVPVYRLPELRGRTRVVIVEGEKDADRLWSLGIPATTNASGAGQWKSHHAGQVAAAGAAEAVLLPDNDEAGERHMHAVAAALRQAGLNVFWCALPDRPPKGDVSDLLDRGLSLERLQALLDTADVYVPPNDLALLSDQQHKPSHDDRAQLEIVAASTIPPRRLTWLWEEWIARGKTTILAGHPGLGKSQLTCFLAAAVSTGGALPGGGMAPLGDVLMVSAEDDPADTIIPRLMAAGADLSRVHLLGDVRENAGGGPRQRGFDLVQDVPRLEEALSARSDVVLVIIDPVTAYMGSSDTHRASDVRAVLRPLEQAAQRQRAAIVMISHLNKSSGQEAVLRVTGSLGFVAAARTNLIVARHPEDDDLRVLVKSKSNLALEGGGFEFKVEGIDLPDDLTTSRIHWTGRSVPFKANELLASPGSVNPEARAAINEAEEWLHSALAHGPRLAKELKLQAREDGVAWRNVQRVKLPNLTKGRPGFGEASFWSINNSFAPPQHQSRHVLDGGANGADGADGADGANGDEAVRPSAGVASDDGAADRESAEDDSFTL